jgi:hypothetical protein
VGFFKLKKAGNFYLLSFFKKRYNKNTNTCPTLIAEEAQIVNILYQFINIQK